MLFYNISQQLQNRVGWQDDRHGSSPILYDTAPLFVYTSGLQSFLYNPPPPGTFFENRPLHS